MLHVTACLHRVVHLEGQLPLMFLLSQAVTEHHVLVLFPHKLVALNRVSRQAVQQLPLTGRSAIGNPLGLAADANTAAVYLYTGAPYLACSSLLQPNRKTSLKLNKCSG
jgi:Pep3/Vps18/deep orange family